MGLVEVRASWPGHPQLSKKEKKRDKIRLVAISLTLKGNIVV